MSILAGILLRQTISSEMISGMMKDGTGIAVVGMITVFAGLLGLTFILPLLQRWIDRGQIRMDRSRTADEGTPAPVRLAPKELAAISAAIHAHMCFLDQAEKMKLTWQDHEKPYTPWRLAGRAEHLQGTESLQNRIRSR